MNAREALLGAKAPIEKVHIKALGYTFTLRGMTGVERDKFETSCLKRVGRVQEFSTDNIRAKLIAFCCVNEDGTKAFTEDDVVALGESRGDVLVELADVARRLSGFGQQELDELGKRSAEATPTNTPSSPSVSGLA